MAKSLITRHELESIVNMKLSADSEKEMKSKLAKIFEGADIDFNSKEFERSFKNIVSAFNAVFSEAGIDAIDLMPGKDEFKKLGEIAYNEFMSAWKAVGEKGGMKFNFNTDQLDEVIDKLDIIAKNTAKTTKASLKKSADEINAAIYRLDKEQKKYESIKKAIEYDSKSSKPKQATIENLEKGYHNAENWEDQYQYLIKYVKTYEKLNELGTVEFTKGQTDLYKTLSKQVDQARTALSNLLMTKEQIAAGMAIGGGTVSINSESLAQEETLSGIKKILEDRLPSQSNTQKTEQPSSNDIKSDVSHNDKPVTKSDLEEYVVYRAVDDYADKRTTRAEGYKNYNAEYWANSKKTAESYTDAHYGTSYILKGKIMPRNPLIIDAEEAQWDDFKSMPKLMELFPDLADFMDKNKNPRYDSDSGQAYINEQAKKAGYDVVIMKNVQDGYMADQDGDAPLTTTFAVLEDSVISITGAFKEIAEENGNKKFSTVAEAVPSFYDVPEHQKNELMRTAIFQELAKYGTFQQAKDAGRGKIEFSGQEVQFGRLVSDYFKDVLGSTFNPKEFEDLWKEARKQFYTFTPKELTKDEAVDILRDKMPENVLEGWFRKGDSTYKSKIEELALSDDDIRNAALNIMWDNYKHSSGKDIGFDEFLHSDIPMYRGKNSEKYTDGDETLAFTFDKSVAEKFGKYVLETFVKPIETLGAYQTTGESEALVYRKQLEDKAGYKQWHEDMSNKNAPQAIYSTETADVIKEETAALTQQNEELRENNTLKREENTIVDGDNRNKNIDTTEEVQSLENVRAKVEDIKTEVEAKTGAFTAEETEVKRVVDAELEALKPLEQKVKDIKDAVTGLNEQTPTEEPVDKSENIPLKDDNIVNETDLAKIKELHSNIEEVARSIKEVVNNVVADETSLQTSVKNSVVKIVQAVQTGQEQLGKLNTSAETLKNNLKGLFENITSGEVNLTEGLSNINVTVNYPKTEQNDLEPVADAIDNLGAKLDSNTGESKSTKNNTDKKTATETTAQKTARYAKRINSYVGKIYSVLKGTQSTKNVANTSNTSDDTISAESSVVSGGETHKESTARNNQTSVNSLIKEYQRLGQMEAKFEVSGNLETKEKIDQLKKYIRTKEISLELTQQEIDDLEKRRIEAHDDEIMLSKASDQEKDRVIAVRELESLYRRLGATEGLLAFRGDKDDASLTQEIDLIQKEIADKKKLIPINQSLIDQFEKLRDNSKHQTVAIETVKEKQQWQNDFKLLGAENQKLAKLDAQAEVTDDPVIQERARQLREIVDKEYERLGLNDQQHAQEKEVLKTSYEQIRAEETKIQLAKQAKKDIADNIKRARQDAKDSTMTSTRKKGETALGSLWKMEDFSIDELKELPNVKELQTAIVNLKKTQSEVNTKIRNKEELTPVDNDKIAESISNVTKYSEAIKGLVKNYEFFSGENSFDLEKKLDPGEDTQAQLIAAAKALHGTKIKVVSYDAATQQLNYTIDDGHNNLTSYTAGVREVDKALRTVQGTTKKTETLFEAIGRKTKEVLTYFTGSSVIYKGIEELRRGVQYVKEIDAALTELKKVTDETEESYERFLDTASKTADKVGSTIAKVVNSTADWARIGYSLEDAASLAETTSVLLNVSEFQSIDEATSALTSTLQAFGYTADDAMNVVDVMNIIGNNFAVSTDGLATALQDSASALMTANNSYEEAAAMVAAANKVVQNPSEVGGALRTIALRLRGTKVSELESMGEDTTGAVETQSKLRAKLKGLTGIDILTDTGAYKSTYEILLEISKVWNNLTDENRAGALELIAGKNRANVASALLSNTKDLEKAYQTALNAEGSALKENEKYLDSIQGKIDQFTNAYQTLWNNTLQSDWIKGIVELGTEIVKIIDKIGGLNTAFLAIASISMIKHKTGPIAFLTQIVDATTNAVNKVNQFPQKIMNAVAGTKQLTAATLEQSVANGSLTTTEAIRQASMHKLVLSQVALTDAELSSLLTTQGLSDAEKQNIIQKLGLTSSTQTLTLATLQQAVADGKLSASEALHIATATRLIGAETSLTAARGIKILTTNGVSAAEAQAIVTALGLDKTTKVLTVDTIKQAVANGTLTASQGAAAMSMLTTTGAAKGLIASIKALWTALGPIGWAILGITAALTIGLKVYDLVTKTTEELAEELSNLSTEISDIESEIDSLNSELETTQERMAELLALPSLSFTEQEELNNLKLQNAELERKIALQETLKKSKEEKKASTSKEYIDKVWNTDGANKAYYIDSDGIIHEDKGWKGFWNAGMDTTSALNQAMQKYDVKKQELNTAENLLANWDSYSDYQKYAMGGKANLGSLFNPVSEEEFNSRPDDFAIISKDALETKISWKKEDLADIAEGINMVLGDEAFDTLEYGASPEINAFLDELYAYGLKLKQLQGEYVKSEAITSLFDGSSTEQMQNLGKKLQKITDDTTLTDAQKEAQIRQEVTDAVNSNSDAYNRLNSAMEIVGVTAQDIADYFILETGAFNSDTIEGVSRQYTQAERVLNALKNASNNTFSLDGITYNFDEFFSKDEEGKLKARADKFGEILKGVDNDTREAFINIVQSAVNGAEDLSQIDWDQAFAKLNFSGLDKTLELLNTEFEALNNEMFKDAADDISGLIDTVSELQAALEDVAGTMDLVRTAQTQMNHSGRISVKTALELMQATENWDSILEITNGTIKLKDGAEQHLIQTELTAIQTQLQYAWTMAQSRYETALAAQGELDYANNSGVVMTAESIKAEAIGRVSAVIVSLGAAMDKLMAGEWGSVWSAFSNTYTSATKTVVANAQTMTTNIAELKKDAENKKKIYEAFSSVDTIPEFKNNYDFNKTPGDKYDSDSDGVDDDEEDVIKDKWDALVNKYENKLALITNQRDLIEAEIDQMEATGAKASSQYYKDLIQNSSDEKDLLVEKKKALEEYLEANKNNIDQDTWTEMNNEINEVAKAIKECTTNLLEYYDALQELDTHYFEQATEEISRLGEELEFVNGLLEDEEVADENGNWSSAAITRLGLYTQEMERAAAMTERYSQEIAKVKGSWTEYQQLLENATDINGDGVVTVADISTDSLNDLYDEYGYVITSQEEYLEQLSNLEDGQRDAIQAYEDAKDGIVELNEARIDAIKDGIDKEIEAYEELIELKKEELDAERDLYDFRKNIKNQTKDIAELERKIAALSGSSAASDVAERRRLEAQLLEAKEGLNDTYYSHAKDQQSSALDEEAEAFSTSKEKYIEDLEATLENTELLIQNSIMDFLFNADVGMSELNSLADTYGITLSDELTQPWEDASAQAIKWKNELQQSMTSGEYAALIGEGGAITVFANGVGEKLTGSWTKAKNEAKKYADFLNGTELKNQFSGTLTTFGTQIQGIVNKWKDVKTAADNAYDAQIRAAQVEGKEPGTGGGGGGGGNNNDDDTKNQTSYTVTATVKVGGIKTLTATMESTTEAKAREYAEAALATKFRDYRIKEQDDSPEFAEKIWLSNYSKKVKYTTVANTFAKGTTGTTKDQWAITDEPWLGDELVLVPGKDGNLQYMRKGTAVMPADISANLIEWGKINPSSMSVGNGMSNLNMISNAINKPEFNLSFEALVKAEKITEDTLPEIKKFVQQEINSLVKQMNYALKGVGSR